VTLRANLLFISSIKESPVPYRHDLEADALTLEEIEAQPPVPRATTKALRIQGPFSCRQCQLAARLPGKALLVWLLVQHVQRLRRTRGAVTLSDELAADYGVQDRAKTRAIHSLAQVGLLSVGDQGKGCAWLLFPVDLSVEQCEQQIELLDAGAHGRRTGKVVSIKAARLKRSGASRRSR
jgi:hypothetical protein